MTAADFDAARGLTRSSSVVVCASAVIELTVRMDFYAAMLKANAFTRSALAIAFVLLYRHLNGRTGRCDPSAATLACEVGLTVRGVEKAIAELRKSGWWRIDQGCGRGHTNSYTPQLEKATAGSGLGAGKGELRFGVLQPENPNGKVRKPERQFRRTSKNQNHTVARSARARARVREADAASTAFETFWRIYPHRGAFPDPKKPAREKFDAAVKRGVDPAVIIAGAERYRAHVERERIEPRFRPQAQTWLNQERWAELYEPEPPRLRVGMN